MTQMQTREADSTVLYLLETMSRQRAGRGLWSGQSQAGTGRQAGSGSGQAEVRNQIRVRQVQDGRLARGQDRQNDLQNGQNREKLGNRTRVTGRWESLLVRPNNPPPPWTTPWHSTLYHLDSCPRLHCCIAHYNVIDGLIKIPWRPKFN
jgi:hypothetical protein